MSQCHKCKCNVIGDLLFCDWCQEWSLKDREKITKLIQEYEATFDTGFYRTDDLVFEEIELSEKDFLDLMGVS